MTVVFLGTPAAAVPSLEALVDAGMAPVLVVTQPDRPVGRSGRPSAPPVKRAAFAHGIEVIQPTRVRTRAFRERIVATGADVLAVVAYGRILSARLLDDVPLGAINLHFSLLPDYRGAAPVQWALARGEARTGVTTMQLDAGMDEGDVLARREVVIEADEHAPALGTRLAELGAPLLVETLRDAADGRLRPEPQAHELATYAPMLSAADGELDAGWTAREVEGRIRGFDPWPGVWGRRDGRRLRLVSGRSIDGFDDAPPGTVVELGRRGLALVCAGGTRLELLTVQPEGRRATPVEAARNGRQLVPGDRLVEHAEGD